MSVDMFIVVHPSLLCGPIPLSVGDGRCLFAAPQHCKEFLRCSMFVTWEIVPSCLSMYRAITIETDNFTCSAVLPAKQSLAELLNPDFDPAVYLPPPTGGIARHRQRFTEAGCRHQHFR